VPKVVHLSSVHDPFDTRLFYKECQSLRQAGYEVVLVAAHEASEVVDGVRIRAVPRPANRFQRFFRTTFQAARAAWAEKPDLIHIHDPELLPFAQLLRLLGRRVIYDMHENVPKDLRTKPWIPAPLRGVVAVIYARVERVLLHRIPVILAETSYERDYPWLPDSVTVLNLPLTAQLLAIEEEPYRRATVGYIGLVSPHRGSRVTIRALKRLEEDGVEVGWECVGRISAECREEAERELGARAQIRGPLRPAEGWAIMARCHIGLAVLESIPNHVESYPTKLFEYMAMGLPVVTSDFPLYREVIETAGCGLCVDPEDAEAVAAAIRWLIEHPAEARAMGERGRAAVRARYNWAAEAEKLLSFYDQILNGPGVSRTHHGIELPCGR
jgi:glycosyltransferase involved in cell wall biosynthesis